MTDLIHKITGRLRLFYHRREIANCLAHYSSKTRKNADRKQVNADTGSFRSQLERLFTIGDASETAELQRIAEAAINACLTNRFYRDSDFLSDIVDALERPTYYTTDTGSEPPLTELEGHARKAKLALVAKAWLSPLKVGSIETVVAAYAGAEGARLPYQRLAAFERKVAQLFALLHHDEGLFLQNRLVEAAAAWRASGVDPVARLDECVGCLEGTVTADGMGELRPRSARLPLRLGTVEHGDRQALLEAALGLLR